MGSENIQFTAAKYNIFWPFWLIRIQDICPDEVTNQEEWLN